MKFENIIYSDKEPSINSLWLRSGKMLYFDGGWKTLIDESAKKLNTAYSSTPSSIPMEFQNNTLDLYVTDTNSSYDITNNNLVTVNYLTSKLQELDNQPFIVGLTLPTTNIDTNKIYLIPSKSSTEGNTYTEHIYIKKEKKWEKLGEYKAEVNLGNYVTKQEFNGRLNMYIPYSAVLSGSAANLQLKSSVSLNELVVGVNIEHFTTPVSQINDFTTLNINERYGVNELKFATTDNGTGTTDYSNSLNLVRADYLHNKVYSKEYLDTEFIENVPIIAWKPNQIAYIPYNHYHIDDNIKNGDRKDIIVYETYDPGRIPAIGVVELKIKNDANSTYIKAGVILTSKTLVGTDNKPLKLWVQRILETTTSYITLGVYAINNKVTGGEDDIVPIIEAESQFTLNCGGLYLNIHPEENGGLIMTNETPGNYGLKVDNTVVTTKKITNQISSGNNIEITPATASTPASISCTLNREEIKKDLFIDMWNDAWTIYAYPDLGHNETIQTLVLGKYDPDNAPDPSTPFRAYDDVWLTYEEAVQVINEWKWSRGQSNLRAALISSQSRVAVPFVYGSSTDIYDLALRNPNIEEIGFYPGIKFVAEANITNAQRAFATLSKKLRKIHGVLKINIKNATNISTMFISNMGIESFHLYNLATNLANLQDAKFVNLDSFQYMIKFATNTTAITITVHPDVYAKITGDTTNASAAALTADELAQWQQLLTDATAKNITFATV